jgi:hypothetical protein
VTPLAIGAVGGSPDESRDRQIGSLPRCDSAAVVGETEQPGASRVAARTPLPGDIRAGGGRVARIVELAIAGALTMVVSIAMIFGGGALFGSVLPAVMVLTSVLGRALFVAGIVLVVLAVVRLIESR